MVSFEEAAIKYAKCYRDKELFFVEQIGINPNAALIRGIANHFKVARQFPINAEDRTDDFEVILCPLSKAIAILNGGNVVDAVLAFSNDVRDRRATRINQRTRRREIPISACSKILWCANPEKGVIMDSRARRSLRRLNHKIPVRDYSSYVSAFNEELQFNLPALNAATPLMGMPDGNNIWASRKLLDLWLYQNGLKQR